MALPESTVKEDFMQDRVNALETALGNEIAEHDFYTRHAERTRNIFGKLLFQKIAAEELEHCERLKSLHARWKKAERWPETIPLSVEGTQVKAFIRTLKQETAEITAGHEDDLKAVRTALSFELKGRDFYVRLRDESRNKREKAFFELLAGIEHAHYLSLLEAEEFLTDPAAWHRKKEISGWLDGGA
jgi:rubrerythrin